MSKTAIVTGGARGIGRAISVALARSGRTVYALYARDRTSAADLTAYAERESLASECLRVDITKEPAVTACIATITRDAPRVEVLGTPIATIRATEDRELFKQWLGEIGVAEVLRRFLGESAHATGWRGDRHALWDLPAGASVLVALTAWDTEDLALAFARDYARVMALKHGLAPLSQYATLDMGDGRRKVVGSTEASRGCKHLCRHCPVVPIYHGQFRVVPPEVVLADVLAQVLAGAEHITFGDPDFFNGPTHAMKIVAALHARHPAVSYDVTIKVKHLLHHRDLVPRLAGTGCAFVTSAVESVDDRVLTLFDKGHTREDFVAAV